MSGILILSYRLKEVTNSCVLHCFELQRILHIFTTTYPIEMEFGSKCSIFTGLVIYIEKSILNIADMRLIPLDRVTNEFPTFETNFSAQRWIPINQNIWNFGGLDNNQDVELGYACTYAQEDTSTIS